jgi:hypothetical protein
VTSRWSFQGRIDAAVQELHKMVNLGWISLRRLAKFAGVPGNSPELVAQKDLLRPRPSK